MTRNVETGWRQLPDGQWLVAIAVDGVITSAVVPRIYVLHRESEPDRSGGA